MKESRIRRNIFILAGVTTLLLIGLVLGWFFVLVRPQKDALSQVSANYEQRKAVADKLKPALADQKKAEDRLQQVKGQFDYLRQRYHNLYFGDIGVDYASETPLQKANRETIWRNWMNYYYNGYGPELQRELQNYATANGVHIVSSIALVSPPNKPEDVAPPATGLLKPLSTSAASTAAPSAAPGGAPGTGAAASSGDGGGSMSVTVSGPLPNILRYFNALNNNSTLVKAGTIKLDTEPGPPVRVRATFTLTPYLLSVGPGAPIAGGQAAAGGGNPGRSGGPGAPPTVTASVSNSASSG